MRARGSATYKVKPEYKWISFWAHDHCRILAGDKELPGAIGFALTSIFAAMLARWATKKAGGVTGDVLGAIEQFGEMSVLAAVVATADRWSVPWWA